MGGRGGASGVGGSVSNGFNGQEHAVEVKWDDGTAIRYRIKGTKMYEDHWGSNVSPVNIGKSELYDVPKNQAEKLLNRAKQNGATAKLITPNELKKIDSESAKRRANDKSDPSLGLFSNGMVAKKYRSTVIRNRRSR